ncbi:MAG TPA: ABC transporter ATP-binding protein [Candidatus Saccharimonadales bacterium]|nr:ABC transporter ATP-binding protein [Candidatus Saccharimonadales bacterium]
MIKVTNLTKTYKTGETSFNALDDVSLEIQKGEFVAILGASGSGKSTLMHLIGGLDKPTSGTIEVDEQNLGKLNDGKLARYRNEKVGFVFQFFNLLQGTSSLNNVTLPLIYSRKKVSRKQAATAILTEVGLAEKLKNRPNQLSGGEQQRVSIARALVNNPEIILADEPTGNLDSKTGLAIFELLRELNKKGKTVVVVTHDNNLAEKADRVIRVSDGRIVE